MTKHLMVSPSPKQLDLHAGVMAATAQTCPLDTWMRTVQRDLKQDPLPERSGTGRCSVHISVDLPLGVRRRMEGVQMSLGSSASHQ